MRFQGVEKRQHKTMLQRMLLVEYSFPVQRQPPKAYRSEDFEVFEILPGQVWRSQTRNGHETKEESQGLILSQQDQCVSEG